MRQLNRFISKQGSKLMGFVLVFVLFVGALCTPFVALNEWLTHPISVTADIFLGDGDFSIKDTINAKVLKYSNEIEKWLTLEQNGIYDVSKYRAVIFAIMMSESGGEGSDPMQSSECGKNEKYPHKVNGIKDPTYSIECGVKYFAECMKKAANKGLTGNEAVYAAIDGYNKGSGVIDAHASKNKYTFEVSCKFCHDHRYSEKKKSYSTAAELKKLYSLKANDYWDGGNWRWDYGNMFYVYRVLNYLNVSEQFVNDGTIGGRIVEEAYKKIGCRYWYGKQGPTYFDCSGLVYWCYKEAGITITRDSADNYSKQGFSVSYQDIMPGDVICFDWDQDGRAEHIGIYIGNDYMIHALGNSSVKGNSSKYIVKKQNLNSYYSSHILSCRRLY